MAMRIGVEPFARPAVVLVREIVEGLGQQMMPIAGREFVWIFDRPLLVVEVVDSESIDHYFYNRFSASNEHAIRQPLRIEHFTSRQERSRDVEWHNARRR